MKTLLLLLFSALTVFAAETPKGEKDITPMLTSATWKWDHPTAKNRTLRFKADGTCETTHWKGVWKIESGRTVTLTQAGNKKTVITFDEKFTGFTGTHHDGLAVTGKRVGEVPSSLR